MRPVDQLPYVEITDSAGVSDRIYADAWVSEDLKISAVATQLAIESGARVSDHYKKEPVTFSCTMYFSDAPIRGDLDPEIRGRQQSTTIPAPVYPNLTPLLSPRGVTKAVLGGVNAVGAALGITPGGFTITSATVLKFEQVPLRLRKTIERLAAVVDAGELVSVGSSVLRIEDLAILGIHLARTSEDGGGGAIDLTFQQIKFAETVQAEAVPLPLEPRGQKKKASATGGTDATGTPKGQSLLKKGLESLKGAFGP